MDDPANRKEEFDRPYVEILFERYGNAMFHTAWRILLDEGLAEDAVMISLEKIHENIDRFYGISEYHTANMVRKYTDHAARDLRRKKNRRFCQKRQQKRRLRQRMFRTRNVSGM